MTDIQLNEDLEFADIKKWIYSPECDCELHPDLFAKCCGLKYNLYKEKE
jgi:hypothetical protein